MNRTEKTMTVNQPTLFDFCTPHDARSGCSVILLCGRCSKCIAHCTCPPESMRAVSPAAIARTMRRDQTPLANLRDALMRLEVRLAMLGGCAPRSSLTLEENDRLVAARAKRGWFMKMGDGRSMWVTA